MTYVNPINVNTQGITGNYGYEKKPKTSEDKKTEDNTATVGQQNQAVNPDEVLNFLAGTAVSVNAPKTVDTSKYVDKASAERIAGFMADFENIVAENLTAISKEFPDMTKNSAMTLALAQADKKSE